MTEEDLVSAFYLLPRYFSASPLEVPKVPLGYVSFLYHSFMGIKEGGLS